MRNLIIPNGLEGFEALKWLKTNKRLFITQKKAAMKQADAVHFSNAFINRSGEISKEAMPITKDDNSLKNSTVINTCLWYDSHGDVHLPGIWNKSISENAKRQTNDIMLLQEHKMQFDKIISDGKDVVPYVKTMSWRELGIDYEGDTEALIFDNIIKSDRNPFMFKQYAQGHVKNHSVGMYYVGIDLAIGHKHKDFADENALWEKWIDKIPNKEEAIEDGMFWAVSQAKVIEGSAVPKGSNTVTPTLENLKFTPIEPEDSTHDEPTDKGNIFKTINKIYSK